MAWYRGPKTDYVVVAVHWNEKGQFVKRGVDLVSAPNRNAAQDEAYKRMDAGELGLTEEEQLIGIVAMGNVGSTSILQQALEAINERAGARTQ